MMLINIREYFEKDGEYLPAKKVRSNARRQVGIVLTVFTGHFPHCRSV